MSQPAIFITPKVLKLLSMKQHGQLLELIMSIGETGINAGSSILSDEYKIHNIVIVRFKASKRGNNYSSSNAIPSEYEVSIKKHPLAKDMTVSLKIACKGTNFRQENVICTEDWCTWISIGSLLDKSFTVKLGVTLLKMQSVINSKLYNDETLTDFTLSGEDGSVVVHKALLAAHSDTFRIMFNSHQWKENKEGCMELKEVSLRTLKHFKEYIYLSTLPNDNEDLRPLLMLATQYLIDCLKTECTLKLLETITAENLDSLVEFCIENKTDELLRIIHETTPESVLAEGYALKIKKSIASMTEVVDKNNTLFSFGQSCKNLDKHLQGC